MTGDSFPCKGEPVSFPAADDVWLGKYSNNSLELRCVSKYDGELMTAESDAPGWKTYVDEKKRPIITVNYGQRDYCLNKENIQFGLFIIRLVLRSVLL